MTITLVSKQINKQTNKPLDRKKRANEYCTPKSKAKEQKNKKPKTYSNKNGNEINDSKKE